MVTSKCPTCSNTSFEVVQHTPKNSNFTLSMPKNSNSTFLFVQCDECGSVVGVLENNDVAGLLDKLLKKIDMR